MNRRTNPYHRTRELIAHYLDWAYTTQLYVLGERRLDSRLRNAIIAEFIRLRLVCHDIPRCQPSRRVSCINTINQGTSVDSPAHRLLVDLSLRSGCPQCYTDDDLEKAFLVDLTQAFFAAVHFTKGVEKQRLIVPRAEHYHV